jgi:valyl-tRNA synthetase
MPLPKNYAPAEVEPQLEKFWQESGIYHFDPQAQGPVYSIDTPPATVSGHLHLGHVYSYSHADFIARFERMTGKQVFYPMGFDDNGLPTEKLVEKSLGITAAKVGRQAFIQKCLEVSEEAEKDYRALWQRLGLSIDWRYTYRTIDDLSRRTAQLSFLDFYQRNLAYRQKAPSIWCPECRTAIAQADLNDLERDSEFVTLPFSLADGRILPVATTRPELLAASVAVFVNPSDIRYQNLLGQQVRIPFYGQQVPILADSAVDPAKGTGAVMCCTFGDQTDMAWWYTYKLSLIEAIDQDGKMTSVTGPLAGLRIQKARQQIKQILQEQGLILERQPTRQSIRVHERCDTPVEILVAMQWFVRVLDHKQALLDAGSQVHWHPEHMQARYQAWVENLNWDWCISRQRYFGVAFPVWYCQNCGAVLLADEDQLPVDPVFDQPRSPCTCGSTSFTPDQDVMDTWATSSLSPQIVGKRLTDPELYRKVFPMSLRPQAHEIIRTWAFYTIVKSTLHFGEIPWKDALISGWGLAGEGMGKISKSRGGGPMAPLEMIRRYSADALRYWAASTSPGKDALISEEKIQAGSRLATKLWNVARFSESFLADAATTESEASGLAFTPADRWILSRLQQVVRRVTDAFGDYDYTSAKNEVEAFFWQALADNYIEMAKQRLYDAAAGPGHGAACFALKTVLSTVLKLFAPVLPYVTEAIYQPLFSQQEQVVSIHRAAWPQALDRFTNPEAQETGEILMQVATAVRRYKSERNISLGSELTLLQLGVANSGLALRLAKAKTDLMSITRARTVEIVETITSETIPLPMERADISIGII